MKNERGIKTTEYSLVAVSPPTKGAVHQIQCCSQKPVTTAGPKARAGLMHIEETGPSSHMSSVTTRGMAMGFRLPHLDLQ